jgi:hypothetical protein
MAIGLVLAGSLIGGLLQVEAADGATDRSAAAAGESFQIERYRLRATNLYVVDAQEESWISNGDEPYAVLAVVRPFGAIAKVDVSRSPVGAGLKDGDTLANTTLLYDGPIDTELGIAVQAIEHDYSNLAAVEAGVRAAAEARLATELAAGTTSPCALAPKIAQALHDGALAVHSPLLDDDDVIGPGQGDCITSGAIAWMWPGDTAYGFYGFAGPDFWGNDANYFQELELERTQ